MIVALGRRLALKGFPQDYDTSTDALPRYLNRAFARKVVAGSDRAILATTPLVNCRKLLYRQLLQFQISNLGKRSLVPLVYACIQYNA